MRFFVIKCVLLEEGEAACVDISERLNGSMSASINDSKDKALRENG